MVGRVEAIAIMADRDPPKSPEEIQRAYEIDGERYLWGEEDYKPFAEVDGRFCIDYMIEEVARSQVKRVVVIAPDDKVDEIEAVRGTVGKRLQRNLSYMKIILGTGGFLTNLRRLHESVAEDEDEPVMYMASDLPLVKGFEIRDFMCSVDNVEGDFDFYVPLSHKAIFDRWNFKRVGFPYKTEHWRGILKEPNVFVANAQGCNFGKVYDFRKMLDPRSQLKLVKEVKRTVGLVDAGRGLYEALQQMGNGSAVGGIKEFWKCRGKVEEIAGAIDLGWLNQGMNLFFECDVRFMAGRWKGFYFDIDSVNDLVERIPNIKHGEIKVSKSKIRSVRRRIASFEHAIESLYR